MAKEHCCFMNPYYSCVLSDNLYPIKYRDTLCIITSSRSVSLRYQEGLLESLYIHVYTWLCTVAVCTMPEWLACQKWLSTHTCQCILISKRKLKKDAKDMREDTAHCELQMEYYSMVV